MIFFNKFLIALHKSDPSLHPDLSQMKRVSILIWVLGWGMYSNSQSISKIKDNLHTTSEAKSITK